jgi:acyl CoA:acetate/3-ketoacid CoA transferase beta subunit
MVLAAADVLCERIRAAGHQTILAGQGLSNLAAWIAERRLRRGGTAVELAAEIGMLGYTPRPANPFLFNFANLPTCTTLSDTQHTLGVEVGGAGARSIGSLGAGQVDRFGNANSTAVPPVLHLVGSGGANDVASAASEVVLTCPADPLRVVEQVPYRTFTGQRVRALATDVGVLTKHLGERELVLTAVPGPRHLLTDAVARARAIFGWPLAVADDLAPFGDPDPAELRWLRAFDPDRVFLGD